MAKLIFINDNAALIECSFVPQYQAQGQEEMAAQVENTVCRPKCGYWKDAAIRNQQRRNQSGGKLDFKLLCLHPTSPYLPMLTQKLKETGNI